MINDRQDEYIRRAEEAELEEHRAIDPQVRASWERIAVGYLELASMAGKQKDRDPLKRYWIWRDTRQNFPEDPS